MKNEKAEIIKAVESVLSSRTQSAVISAAETARLLNVSRRTVAALAAEGRLTRAFLPGRKRPYGFTRASVEALLAGREGGVK